MNQRKCLFIFSSALVLMIFVHPYMDWLLTITKLKPLVRLLNGLSVEQVTLKNTGNNKKL